MPPDGSYLAGRLREAERPHRTVGHPSDGPGSTHVYPGDDETEASDIWREPGRLEIQATVLA